MRIFIAIVVVLLTFSGTTCAHDASIGIEQAHAEIWKRFI
jgi:hypothetical protein